MNDPRRWLEESHGARSFEQRLLLAGKELEPPRGAEEQVWAALAPIIGPGPGGPGPSAPATPDPTGAGGGSTLASGAGAKSAFVATKFFVVGAAVGLGSVVGARGVVTAVGPARPPVSAMAQTACEPGVPGQHVTDLPVRLAASAPAASNPEQTRARETRPASSAEPTSPVVAGTPALPVGNVSMPNVPEPADPSGELVAARIYHENQLKEEATELASAKNLLGGGQAQAAFELLERSSQRFPSGALVLEREALLVEACFASGRRELGRQHAHWFLTHYPESPLAARIQKLATQNDRQHGLPPLIQLK